MNPVKLSSGSLVDMCIGEEEVVKPVLQILGFKQMPAGEGQPPRYRVSLSDGVNYIISAILATQMNHLVEENELIIHGVIRVDKYMSNTVSDKQVLILLNFTVIESGHNVEKIGEPDVLKTRKADLYEYKKVKKEVKEEVNSGAAPIMSNNMAGTAKPNQNQDGGFYGNKAAPAVRTSSSSRNQIFGGGGMGVGDKVSVHPIAGLTPYQNRWMIKARVTNKTPVKHWSNSRGEGKLFSMDLLDNSGEIRCTAFKAECDKFFDIIEIGNVYYISKGQLKTANRQFTSINNDYEMTLTGDSVVQQCNDGSSAPTLKYNFTKIDALQQQTKDSMVDVIGICKNVSEIQQFTSRAGKDITKREVTLVDQSKCSVTLTLWGEMAQGFEGVGLENPVVAIRGARVSDFSGVSLNSLHQSLILVNPDMPESFTLKGWYDHGGAGEPMQSLSTGRSMEGTGNATRKNWEQMKLENLGHGDKPDYFAIVGTIIFIKRDNCLYKACPSDNCNKKVIDMEAGNYRCEKCGQTFNSFKWRLMLSVNVADHTDSHWIMCFQDSAEKILNSTADELGNLKENDTEAFEQIMAEANFKSYIFKVRAHAETYNDETRLKMTTVAISDIDTDDYEKRLEEEIEKLKDL